MHKEVFKMGISSLNNQAAEAIKFAYEYKRSKHIDKITGRFYDVQNPFIYSSNTKDNLTQLSKEFVQFVKNEHGKEVVFLSQITKKDYQNFLDYKANSGVRFTTLSNYKSLLTKLSKVYHHKFKSVRVMHDLTINKDKLEKEDRVDKVRNRLSSETINRVIANLSASEGVAADKLYKSVLLSNNYGLRASEVCNLKTKDIDLESKTITIYRSKGGKTRTLDIKDKDLKFFRNLINDKKANDLVIGYKSQNALNNAFKRYADKNIPDKHLKLSDNQQLGFHNFRKNYAQNEFDYYRNRVSLSREEAVAKVNLLLGHEIDRGEKYLQSTYLEYIY